MSDEKAGTEGKAPLRSITTDREKKPDGESASHVLGEMRHSPEMIRELFRTGQYPYKNKSRNEA